MWLPWTFSMANKSFYAERHFLKKCLNSLNSYIWFTCFQIFFFWKGKKFWTFWAMEFLPPIPLTDSTYDVNWSMIQSPPVVVCSGGGGSIVCVVDGWGGCVISLPSPTVNIKHSFPQSPDLPAICNCHWDLNEWLTVAPGGTPPWHTPDWLSTM